MRSDNLYTIPSDVAVPEDDGACDHLTGAVVPSVTLTATNGLDVDVGSRDLPLVVLFFYPRTGQPDKDALGGTTAWNQIPGARGCTPQTCGYRDVYKDFENLGAAVYGVSTQTTAYQKEAALRLQLPFSLLSDEGGKLLKALSLPTFEVAGSCLIKRLALVIRHGVIVKVFYPVFPANENAATVLAWIKQNQLC